ncbi:cupin domain-containing protein [Aneurinibacillus tyrosinisolvens]|uniref:cupin domain-containing protein n=1 Tax=Aneurinibacillus tyrosinisolvens TaxID=1443435 RepID=UPI00063F09B6|nr:cupin domain-containing protein [Aneurinibacillus tyrosinisolvens]
MSNEKFIVWPEEVETMAFDWGCFKITCASEVTGATKFSAGVVVVEPGKGHDRHNHPGAEEIIYVLSGEGEQMVEDENGNPQTYKVTPGCTVYVPEGRYHYTINKGWEPLKTFVVYSPAGAEKGLRELPDCRIVSPGQIPKR